MRGDRPATIRIADDDRARIPFAMIGVLLLVSSIAIVGILESRPDSRREIDESLAMDRTATAIQSEVRYAAVAAIDDAARAPVTDADTSTELGAAVDAAAGSDFEGYAALRVYLEVMESLPAAGQEFDGGVETVVRPPAPTDPTEYDDGAAEALEYVDLDTANADDGTVDVTVRDVRIDLVDEHGDSVHTRTQDVTVTVGTLVFQMHDQTEEYQEQLEMGFFEPGSDHEGFSRYLGARLYPTVAAKVMYDRLSGEPGERAFENVTPNDHTELLANDAIYALQESTFGTSDSYSDRAMRGPTICFAYDIGNDTVLDDFDSSYLEDQFNVTPEELCDSDLLFGDADGDFEDAPTFQEIFTEHLLGNNPLEREEEFYLLPFAELALVETSGYPIDELDEFQEPLNESGEYDEEYLEEYYNTSLDNSTVENDDQYDDVDDDLDGILNEISRTGEVDDAIDSVHEIEVWANEGAVSASGDNELPSDDEHGVDTANYTAAERYYEVTSARVTNVEYEETASDPVTRDRLRERLGRVTVDADVDVREITEWEAKNETKTDPDELETRSDTETLSFTKRLSIWGEIAPDANIDRGRDLENAFDGGPFESAPEDAYEELFTESTVRDGVEADLENVGEYRGSGVESELRSTLDGAVEYEEDSRTLDGYQSGIAERRLEEDVEDTHLELLLTVQSETAMLKEFVFPPSPFRKLEDDVADNRDSLTYDGIGSYDDAEDMAIAETRYRYFDNLEEYIDELADKNEEAGGEADDLIGGIVDKILGGINQGLEDIVGIAQDLLAGDVEEQPATSAQSPLMEEAEIRVDGSPTYLTLETINRSEIPAVRSGGTGPAVAEDPDATEHAPMAANYTNAIGYPGLPVIPWPSFFFLQVDAWVVEVKGEYARFEVTANSGDATAAETTNYVREDRAVSVEIDGEEHRVGDVEPITIDGAVPVVMFVPSPTLYQGGSPGVGDAIGAPGEGCSTTWDHVGPDWDGDECER